ncbi:hypothetical protein [Nocardia sp. NBC_01009]|uniref:hypothetical protein n=1 Tax=Nocardia sp. NBC_01009 TaxID=2975996 RepID=UPI00386EC007|nr:hypothetical protein OHA42_34980 [Nocardia sp. NBC_01009]
MYARSSTIAAQPSSIDSGIAYLRDEAMPSMPELEGWVGLSLLVDRGSGRCIATSAWESEAAMHDSRGQVKALRAGVAQALNGQVDLVQEWEIALMHRDQLSSDGACTRCTWLQAGPGEIDRLIDTVKMSVLPQAETMDGFCSSSLFVDRATDRAVGAMVWANREALDNSREPAKRIRTAAARTSGASVLEVAEFELGFAHLRVPEMA